MAKYRQLMTILAFLTGIISCQKAQEPENNRITGISINPESVTLVAGETATLSTAISPAGFENTKILWTTSNPFVATVDKGVVTAISQGQATITAKTEDGGKTATCTVTVNPAKVISVESISLNESSVELTEGDSRTLIATIKPDNASNKKVVWSSDDTSIATVSAGGRVTALKIGSATITATTIDGGKTDTCTLTVIERSNNGGNEDVYYKDWK